MEQVIFFIISAVLIGSALVVVTSRNLFHAALALMATFFGVAAMYVLLEAGFLAAAQLLVYIGAISILIIFAIMMTRRLMSTTEEAFNSQWGLGLFASMLVLVILVFVIGNHWPLVPDAGQALAHRTPVSESVLQDSVVTLGQAFVGEYVLAFELASVLLLAALIGAIMVAWPPEEEEV
jgi:NADH-quinone oxidoreductase subunit J